MPKPIILLMEDLGDSVPLARKVLSAQGYEVLWANTGQRGLEIAGENPPGLILLDLDLPDIDSPTLVRHFRSLPGLEDVPILLVAPGSEEGGRAMSAAYGCDGYLGKPVDIRSLSSAVQQYLPLK